MDIVSGVTEDRVPVEKLMRLRYAGTCRVCGAELPAKVEAVYERTAKTVRCLGCPPAATEVDEAPPTGPDPGQVVEVTVGVRPGCPGLIGTDRD